MAGPDTLTLSRGISLPNEPFRYWSVADTTLDAANPTASEGGDYELAGGPSRTILIRFGDLDRAVAGRKVLSARIVLHVSDGAASLQGVSRVKQEWGEGPMRRPSFMKPQPGDPPEGRGAATWRSRMDGLLDWQMQGANGPDDAVAVPEAKLTKLDNDEVAIDGLGPAVADMASKWYENFGFAFHFETSVMFESSQAPFGRPRLELTLGDRPAQSGPNLAVLPLEAKDAGDNWEISAKVKNIGNEASAGFRFVWLNETRGGVMSENAGLAPNAEATLKNRIPKHGQDPRFASVALRVYPTGPDASPSDDEALVYLGGVDVDVSTQDWQAGVAAARFVNETVFGQSRFSFARDGVGKRVNPVLAASAPTDFAELVRAMVIKAGAPDIRSKAGAHPYAEGMLGGETRCEAILFPQISLPSEPYFTPILDNSGLEPTDLLGMTQVAALNGLTPTTPKAILIRPVNRMGIPYQNVELSFYKPGDDATPIATLPGTPTEAMLLPAGLSSGDLIHTVYHVRGTKRGVSSDTYLYGYQFLDSSARGSSAAAIIDLPLDLPTLDLGETNLAEGKLVTDSANRSLDDLGILTKDGNATPIKFSGKQGSWVEIDLGRDRSVGELTLESKNLPRTLDVLTYETGQHAPEAMTWIRETDAQWRLQNRSTNGALVFRPAPAFCRFIRIVSRFDQADWELSGIKVKSAKVEQ